MFLTEETLSLFSVMCVVLVLVYCHFMYRSRMIPRVLSSE